MCAFQGHRSVCWEGQRKGRRGRSGGLGTDRRSGDREGPAAAVSGPEIVSAGCIPKSEAMELLTPGYCEGCGKRKGTDKVMSWRERRRGEDTASTRHFNLQQIT